MTTWIEVPEARYWEMLECLPPEIMTGHGFLVGEPWDHNAAGQPRFSAFVELNGKHYESAEPLTVAQFKALKTEEIA